MHNFHFLFRLAVVRPPVYSYIPIWRIAQLSIKEAAHKGTKSFTEINKHHKQTYKTFEDRIFKYLSEIKVKCQES